MERSKTPGVRAYRFRPALAGTGELEGRLRHDPQLDRPRGVAREVTRDHHVVDQHEAVLRDSGVARAFVQLVLKPIGLVGQRIGGADRLQRVIRARNGDAGEVHSRDVDRSGGGQGLESGHVSGVLSG